MIRRSFTLGGLVSAAIAAMGWRGRASADSIPDYEVRALKDAEAARRRFPYELVESRGDQAYAKWKELKAAGRGTPVVLGGDASSLRNLFGAFGAEEEKFWPRPPLEETLAAAARIRWPDDLVAKHSDDNAKAERDLRKMLAENPESALPTILQTDAHGHSRTLSREETLASILENHHEPELGEWPARADGSPGLSVAYDIKGAPLSKIFIALIPTNDWTTIPAYLRFGDWNECPAPEYHIAALRSWRDRYGVELVGMAFDTLNLTAARPPTTRDAAIALAKEQFVYCNDIIDQGLETYSNLAAALMANDWWYFWWD